MQVDAPTVQNYPRDTGGTSMAFKIKDLLPWQLYISPKPKKNMLSQNSAKKIKKEREGVALAHVMPYDDIMSPS